MITTIIFDLSEVYLKGFVGVEEFLEVPLGLRASEIKTKLTGPEFWQLMNGEIVEEEFWKRLIERNGWNIDIDKLKGAVRENFNEIEGTREIIEELKKKGYVLGLLSDHSREWIDYCNKKFDYHKLFHSRQYSFEVGCCKSDKNAFLLLLKKLGVNAENCLFIDDHEKNVLMARSIGLNAIQFKNPIQLRNELISLSLL